MGYRYTLLRRPRLNRRTPMINNSAWAHDKGIASNWCMWMNSKPDFSFEYHTHCEFCSTECEQITGDLPNYVMVTNVWNERDKIERAFQRMTQQSVKPLVWLWIDDGSIDGTYEEIVRVSEKYPDFEVWIEKMPEKEKGDLNTIGVAYTVHMPGFIERLNGKDIHYFTIQDVGTAPCPNYYARVMKLMNSHPTIGSSSGYMVGEEKARESGMPMGDCKVTRWTIIKGIKKYWPLSPDTFVNIKVLKQGYKLKIWRVPVLQDEVSFGVSSSGMFYQGQLNYYIGRPLLGVFIRALRRVILRRHGTQLLRGYLFERKKGTWRCDDSDVTSFYGHGKSFIWIIVNLIKTRGRFSN